MRRLLPLLLLLLAPHVAADPPKAKPPGKGTSYAFLVAAAEYDKNELRPLPYSGKETAEFREVLLRTGFDEANVKMLHDKAERRYLPTRKQITEQLDLLLSRAEANDTVVVLLNGHGVHFTGDPTGYFCPVDAKLTDKSTLVPMDSTGGVFELLKGCKAKRKVLLVNACWNDPRSEFNQAGDKIKIDDEDKEEVPEGIAALYSCKAGEKSYFYDPKDVRSKGRERSLYMHHLIEAWGQGGKTTLEDVFAAVRRGAAADADNLFNRKQNPVVRREYKGEGEWLIAAGPAAAVKPKDGDETVEPFDWKGERRTRVVRKLKFGGEEVEFVKVKAGSFQMGLPESDKAAGGDEKPQHTVTFTKDLWVSKCPITKRQFAAFVTADGYTTEAEADGKGGSGYDGKSAYTQDAKYTWENTGWPQTDKHPVVNVSWNDAAAYCDWASRKAKMPSWFVKNKKDGRWDLTDPGKPVGVRLLTEAEYEFVNRGGTDTVYFTGDDVASLEGYANLADKTAKAKFDFFKSAPFDDGEVFTSPVGKFKANGYGLHDTTGNVWSWCADWYDEKVYAGRKGGVTDPPANTNGEQKYRILRGGAWDFDPADCCAAYHISGTPGVRSNHLGFRVCVVLD